MLVQKKSASRRMLFLWIGIGAVVLVAGFLIYQNVVVLGGAVTPTEIKDRVSRLDIPKNFGEEIFSDPRLNKITENVSFFEGYINQYSVTALSESGLDAPESIEVFNPGYGGKLFVSWSTVEGNVTGYALFRSTGAGSDFEEIAFIPANEAPTYVDDQIINDQSYLYRVKAVNFTEKARQQDISSGTSGSVTVEQVTGGGNVISWDEMDGVEAIQILRKRGSTNSVIVTLQQGETLFVDTSGQSGDSYSVVWYATYRLSLFSDTASGSADDSTAPEAPSDITIENIGDGSSVAIFWTNPLDPDFDYVEIFRSDVQGALGQPIKTERSEYAVLSSRCVRMTEEDRAKIRASLPSLSSEDDLPEQNCFIDEVGVDEGSTYYYTLISHDLSGNTSVNNIISGFGKENPFTGQN